MKNKNEGGSNFKKNVYKILQSDNMDSAVVDLYKLPAKKVVNALFSFLQSTRVDIKWAAVTAMGSVVSKIADEDMEAARVIMRRLMWNLNDESGGIGWGSPEAMGEILACHKGLAEEYAHILLSYARQDGNYLELEILQRGLLWGIGRLCQKRPHLLRGFVQYLVPYLDSNDAIVRGLAVWVICLTGAEDARVSLEGIRGDESEIQIYIDRRFQKILLKDLVKDALEKSA